MGCGAVGGSLVGAYYQPENRTGAKPEIEPVIIRKHLDNFHVCIRQGDLYLILADTKTKWLANRIANLVSENLNAKWP